MLHVTDAQQILQQEKAQLGQAEVLADMGASHCYIDHPRITQQEMGRCCCVLWCNWQKQCMTYMTAWLNPQQQD